MRHARVRLAIPVVLLAAMGVSACADSDSPREGEVTVDTTEALTSDQATGVFSFRTDDLCEWLTGEDIAGFVTAEFDWQGTAEEGTAPAGGGCEWALTDSDGTSGWVWAGEATDPGASVVQYDPADPLPFDVAVSGHPGVSDGVVVYNGGYGTFLVWTPPIDEYLHVSTSDLAPGYDADDYVTRLFGFADRVVNALNWLPTPERIDYEGGATYLEGEIAGFLLAEGTRTVDANGNEHTREGTVSYRVVSDDPRVAGDVTGTWNTDRWGTGINNGALIQWGHATLRNEGGQWTAPYEGAFASPYGDIVTRWWRGAGDYEGLTFYMWIAGSVVNSPHFDWYGLIFPGDPPLADITDD